MQGKNSSGHDRQAEKLSKIIAAKEREMKKAQQYDSRSIWLGLGMMGLIGWSFVIPVILGAGIGIYLDRQFKMSFSWTLILLTAGVILGGINASRWVIREYRKIQNERGEKK